MSIKKVEVTAGERAKELGCVIPLSMVAHIKGVTRQTVNNTFKYRPALFDILVLDAVKKWESICEKGTK